MTALDTLADIGYWSIDAVWLPMLVWTLVALPVTMYVARSRRLGSPQVSYGLTVSLIAALPIGLLASPLSSLVGSSSTSIHLGMLPGIVFGTAETAIAADGVDWSTAHTAGTLLIVSVLAAAWRLCGLMVAGFHLRALRTAVATTTYSQLESQIDALKAELRIVSPVRCALSARAVTPLTFGWIRPVIVIPKNLLQRPDDLRLALLHELIHIRRHDFAIQWIEHLVGAIFAIHPLMAVLGRESRFLREATCDAEVVRFTKKRGAYARLLYSYSADVPAPWQLAIGIYPQERHLKQRIDVMKNSTERTYLSRAKYLGFTLAVGLFGLSVSLVACTEQFVETEKTSTAQAEIGKNDADTGAYVTVEEMPTIIGGLQTVQEYLTYPEIAKEQGVEGRVIVTFLVDENGDVQNAEIEKGIGAGLDEVALNAVKQTKFEPGRQKGEAVTVKMSLPISFKLPGSEADSFGGAMQIYYDISGPLIEGRITDEATGMGLAGVNIAIDGSSTGAATGPDGQFTLRLEQNARGTDLKLTRPGYADVIVRDLK